jgi:hypothetical protein
MTRLVPDRLAVAGHLASIIRLNGSLSWETNEYIEPNPDRAALLTIAHGTSEGSGLALQYTLFSLCGVAIGLGDYAYPLLRNVEAVLPDRSGSSQLLLVNQKRSQ